MTDEFELYRVPPECRPNSTHPAFKDYYYDMIMYGDKLSFKYREVECIIERHPVYHYLCGYALIEIPDTLDLQAINVHGGISLAEGNKIGFGCYHYRDFIPGKPVDQPLDHTYKDFDFVREELKKIVDACLEKN